jgi:hypothetical protein
MQVLAGPPPAAGARQPSPVAEMIEVVGPTYTPTCCTASTPAWRPSASAPPRPWACGTFPPKPGRSTQDESSRRTSPPGPASLATATTSNSATRNPETLRYRVWHLPASFARHARHARRRTLAISPDWRGTFLEGCTPSDVSTSAMRSTRSRVGTCPSLERVCAT